MPIAIRNGALAAGATLTLTGRGDLWSLAIAFGVADASALTAVAVLAAAAAALARTGSAGLADVAGAQAVLGAAGFTGSSAAIGATWASALCLLGVARDRAAGAGLGLVAGVLVAGPSLSGGAKSVVLRIVGVVVGAAVGWVVAPRAETRSWQCYAALAIGAVGLALAVAAGYH